MKMDLLFKSICEKRQAEIKSKTALRYFSWYSKKI